MCYLEPVLAKQADYAAHPAFSKLFLESAPLQTGRLYPPSGAQRGRRAALAVLWDAPDAFFDTSREQALGRGGLRALEQALQGPAHSSAGAVLDPCLLLRVPVTLEPGGTFRLRLTLAAGQSGEEAVEAARRLQSPRARLGNVQLERLMTACKLTGETTLQAFELLAALVYPGARSPAEQSLLWPYGISGDLPIAALTLAGAEEAETALPWLGCTSSSPAAVTP